MNKLDEILRRYTVQGEDTENKLLGAAFVVTDKEGKQLHSAQFKNNKLTALQELSIPAHLAASIWTPSRPSSQTRPSHG
jgi:hypothetical protein